MENAIASAERCGIRTLKLDATNEGRPLYESLGFVVEQTVERWGRDREEFVAAKTDVGSKEGCCYGTRISDEMYSQDAKAFGVTRKELLEALSVSGRLNTTENGYILSRPEEQRGISAHVWRIQKPTHRQLIAEHLGHPMCSGEEHEEF
jgi:hypothetical protein